MVGIVIASHGEFCEGLKGSTEMIAGNIPQCVSVSLHAGEDPDEYGVRLKEAADGVDDGNGVLILVDLRGGTPFNRSLMLSREKNIDIVIGANLPMLLTLTLERKGTSTVDDLAEVAENAGKENIGIIKYRK